MSKLLRVLLLLTALASSCAPAARVAPPAKSAAAPDLPPSAAPVRHDAAAKSGVSVYPRTFLTSGGWACALDAAQKLFCWLLTSEQPSNIPHVDRRPTMSQVPGLGPIEALDGKEDYVCALDAAGAVHCWGCAGSTVCTLWPAQVALKEPARAIAVGVDGACALASSGSVWCWGLAAHGGSEVPRKVPRLDDVVQLSATALGRCALQRDGGVSCWGDCSSDGCAAREPVRITGLAHAHAIASNRSYSCAVAGPQRQVQCWGLPEAERTRWESERPRSQSALQAVVTLEGLRDVRQLELGERFGVALTGDGSVYHWGATHPGDLYAFGGEPEPRDRPKYTENLEPRARASVAEDLDLEVVQIGEQLHAKRVLVTGYNVCLDLERGGLRCEPALARAPFQIEEVWPSVRFGAGAEP